MGNSAIKHSTLQHLLAQAFPRNVGTARRVYTLFILLPKQVQPLGCYTKGNYYIKHGLSMQSTMGFRK